MLHLCTDVVVSDPGGPWLAHLPCKMESDQLKNETDEKPGNNGPCSRLQVGWSSWRCLCAVRVSGCA
jgi:hypothetical protein